MATPAATKPLVLLRHAQSLWNLENRFTGWADVGLTDTGREEARRAGVLLRAHGYRFDRAFASQLKRATETLDIVLRELGQENLPAERSWRLNERHYGSLEGLDKAAFAVGHGEDMLHRLRRGYRDRPAPLATDDPRHPRHQEIYRDIDPALLPATESLADTLARLLPYWSGTIAPANARGERILIVSHGNTLRALLKHLEKMTEHDVEQFEIPTGRPLVVEFAPDGGFLRRDYLDVPAAAPPNKATVAGLG
jgi:2,3-bisphosphoglycerate-dependent phosphoglycerate mutase